MKLKIIQYYYSEDLDYLKQTERINSTYCEKYQIDYYCEKSLTLIKDTCHDRNFSWFKIQFLLNTIRNEELDYVMFIDADAFIKNDKVDIRDIIREYSEFDFICSRDFGPDLVNGGVLIFKKTEWSENFLERVWDLANYISRGKYKTENWLEQTILSTFLMISKEDASKTKILENSMENSINSLHFNDSAFIYHDLSKQRIGRFHDILFGETDDFSYMDLVTESDRHVSHRYFDYYIPLIHSYNKNGIVPKVLDIGSDGDNGLTFKYLIETTSCKIDYYCLSDKKNNVKNGKIFPYDSMSEEKIENFFKETNTGFDIIIDDNSHRSIERNWLLMKMFNKLNNSGYYIVEDLQTDDEIKIPSKNEQYKWGDPEKKSLTQLIEQFQKDGTLVSDYFDFKNLNEMIQEAKIITTKSSSKLGVFQRK